MDVREKIEEDYKKLKSLKIAEDIIQIINNRKQTCLDEMVEMLQRVVKEYDLDKELKGDITLKIHKEIFGNCVVGYIKNTRKELGL